jgi:hypothetical protein
MSVQPLFTPARMGDLDLPNRRDGAADSDAGRQSGSCADRTF